MNWFYKNMSSFVAIVVVFLMIPFFVHSRKYIINHPVPVIETIEAYPSTKFAKVMFLGFDAFAADILFTKAQYYFGGHYYSDKQYPLLEQMIDVVTTLNPKLKYVFLFGESALASMGTPEAIEASNRILDKGHKYYPEDYVFVFDKGINYYMFLNDFKRAYPFLYKGARMKGVPKSFFWLVSKVLAKGGAYKLGYQYTLEKLKHTKDKHIKIYLKRRLKYFGDLILLTNLSEKYKQKTGSYPSKDLKELVQKHYIKSIPEEPFGGHYFFDKNLGKVVSDTKILAKKRNAKKKSSKK